MIYDIEKLRHAGFTVRLTKEKLVIEPSEHGWNPYRVAREMLDNTDFSGVYKETLINQFGDSMLNMHMAETLSSCLSTD